MKFFDKIRESMAHFMSGRYGSDQLGFTMVITSLILTIIGAIFGIQQITVILADILLILMVIRMFSKDRIRRANENKVFLEKTEGIRRAVVEWANRMKNMKKYHYYTCPKCKKRLRVPRGVGNITITCKFCGEKFDKKA